MIHAVVESVNRRDAIAWLRLGRGRLASRLWEGIRPGQHVNVRIRPEDVILCAEHPGRISARNVVPGHVVSVKSGPEGMLVTTNIGFALDALVTRGAVRELGLKRGSAVFVVIKATAIRPEAAVRAKLRVSVKAKRGLIGPERLTFLRSLERLGSLSSSARDVGITYRTAWLWVESMNAAWGKALVKCTRGGRGGGGAVLTAEGRGLLALIERAER